MCFGTGDALGGRERTFKSWMLQLIHDMQNRVSLRLSCKLHTYRFASYTGRMPVWVYVSLSVSSFKLISVRVFVVRMHQRMSLRQTLKTLLVPECSSSLAQLVAATRLQKACDREGF